MSLAPAAAMAESGCERSAAVACRLPLPRAPTRSLSFVRSPLSSTSPPFLTQRSEGWQDSFALETSAHTAARPDVHSGQVSWPRSRKY